MYANKNCRASLYRLADPDAGRDVVTGDKRLVWEDATVGLYPTATLSKTAREFGMIWQATHVLFVQVDDYRQLPRESDRWLVKSTFDPHNWVNGVLGHWLEITAVTQSRSGATMCAVREVGQ